MSRGLSFAAAFAAIVPFALPAAPAQADGFSFSYSSGYSRSGPHWDRHHHPHRYHRHGPPPRIVYHAPPRHYYRPAPRVIYTQPPVIYAPPPTVVYADPPPVVYAPPVVANNVLPGGPLQAPAPYCREYQSSSVVGGRQVYSYGTACQQPDGSWRIVR